MGDIRQNEQRFDTEEAADILDLASALEERASERQSRFAKSDLHRIADELGISPSAVDAAIRSMQGETRATARARKKAVKRRLRFIRHAIAYTTVVLVLATIDALGGGGWWFFYVAGGWGILLALHATRFITRRNGPLEARMLREPFRG